MTVSFSRHEQPTEYRADDATAGSGGRLRRPTRQARFSALWRAPQRSALWLVRRSPYRQWCLELHRQAWLVTLWCALAHCVSPAIENPCRQSLPLGPRSAGRPIHRPARQRTPTAQTLSAQWSRPWLGSVLFRESPRWGERYQPSALTPCASGRIASGLSSDGELGRSA